MTWVTVTEFAEWSGEAVSTIRKKCQTGELPSRKFGVRWKIDRDLFEKQAEKEMLNRMERSQKIDVPKVDYIDGEAWRKKMRAKALERIKEVKA